MVYFIGANFGTVVSLPVSGWLCGLKYMGGWPLAFYIFGVFGIIWFGFWIYYVYDTPSSHPRICRQEQAFILASIGPQVSIKQRYLQLAVSAPAIAKIVGDWLYCHRMFKIVK